MKNSIWKLFGFANTLKVPSASVAAQAASDAVNGADPLTIEDGSDNAMRRQLVQVLLRDILRKHGIAPHWIELQMLVISRSRRGAGLYVRLIVRHWDERLMNHLSALQNTLLIDIARFEPNASDWLHGISWQFEITDSCPYTTLPDKTFWAEIAASPTPVMPQIAASSQSTLTPAAPAKQPSKESEALEDLQSLFRVRDQDISRHSGGMAIGYEKTQPLPLSPL
jgi:hypothetical protein